MEKPVYYEDGDPQCCTTPFETRTYEVKILITEKFIELDADDRTRIYELTKRIERQLQFGRDVETEVIEVNRTTELEHFEHMPTLEHILQYIAEKGERDTRRFAAEKSGALGKNVFGNSIW